MPTAETLVTPPRRRWEMSDTASSVFTYLVLWSLLACIALGGGYLWGKKRFGCDLQPTAQQEFCDQWKDKEGKPMPTSPPMPLVDELS